MEVQDGVLMELLLRYVSNHSASCPAWSWASLSSIHTLLKVPNTASVYLSVYTGTRGNDGGRK